MLVERGCVASLRYLPTDRGRRGEGKASAESPTPAFHPYAYFTYTPETMAAMSVTMAGLAPVGVKQTRVSRASRSAVPAKAHLGSAFTAGGRVDFNGQKLSLGVAASARSKSGGSRCVTTMAAKIAGYIKLAIEAGKANPAPPIGPALGAKVRLPER